jgi:peptidoglycan biosynthesis protein MviN/MurJ (putative lipid II flippase)
MTGWWWTPLVATLLAFLGTTGWCRRARPRYFESLVAPSLCALVSLIFMLAMLGMDAGWRVHWGFAAGLLAGFLAALLLQIIAIARLHARWRRKNAAP